MYLSELKVHAVESFDLIFSSSATLNQSFGTSCWGKDFHGDDEQEQSRLKERNKFADLSKDNT